MHLKTLMVKKRVIKKLSQHFWGMAAKNDEMMPQNYLTFHYRWAVQLLIIIWDDKVVVTSSMR